MSAPEYRDAERFVAWLLERVLADGRGDNEAALPIKPEGRFWLGRLSPEERTRNSVLGERGERVEPCEIGIRVRPTALDGRLVRATVRCVAWRREDDPKAEPTWTKLAPVECPVELRAPTGPGQPVRAGGEEIRAALAAAGAGGLSAEVQAEIESGPQGPELVIAFVNTSPLESERLDTTLYETSLAVDVGPTEPFVLDALEDSFRYERTVDAYGINGGVDRRGDVFATTDVIVAHRPRPVYWDTQHAGPEPDLTFRGLADDPLPLLRRLAEALRRWGDALWSREALDERGRAERWHPTMRAKADEEAAKFREEVGRVERGLVLLERDPQVLRAFRLTNRAFALATAGRYDRWRPFQLGFLLASLPSIQGASREAEAEIVDALWFATGGGKTETYLAILVVAAFLDRLVGKICGITAWVRFPLRMLSLQQTQRFADVFAAAELVRREEKIAGTPFSVGFLVGPATPNRIKKEPEPHEPKWSDPDMPARYQVLLMCPFCRSDRIRMAFDPARWTLDHLCGDPACPWGGAPLPFRVVDEELYRFLPTAVVGTLDKAANLGMQSAMRAFYGAPLGLCPVAGHGFTYVPRSHAPTGCLFPGCSEKPKVLPQPAELFPPRIRMQDELHLLRDALGAVDSHYEALFDHLQKARGVRSKILASSATLAGFTEQVDTLYQRKGRLFPVPGPRAEHSFWARASDRLMRTFVGVAPRSVTLEFATDRTNEAIQRAVRWVNDHPAEAAGMIGVAESSIPGLVCQYGISVVYGSTIRDVEAAARSFETQIPLDPLNAETLTGNTPFEDVRRVLEHLNRDCEQPLEKRLHLIAASSMLSHGVDVERLNVMVMLGLPLSAAEFIQTTARIGRTWPGLVFVLHKINRERDAAIFRMFRPFVEHADRFVDPVPITRRSRRVLEKTFGGIFQGRLFGVHEERSVSAGLRPLTTISSIRTAFQRLPVLEDAELAALVELLGVGGPLDENIRADLEALVREVFRAVGDPATTARDLGEVFPNGRPMLSLRDVEEQVPVYTRGGTGS